jgi:low affinity Fe/Cu permease
VQSEATVNDPQDRKPSPEGSAFVPATQVHKDHFGQFANTCSTYLGSRWAFAAAVGVIVVWAILGPVYHFSDTWQLVINTGTTIVTFLMVFLIQNTQNRDARAINLKLNELIDSIKSAHNEMIDIEHLSDAELDILAARYEGIRQEMAERRANLQDDSSDTKEQSDTQEQSAAR